MKNSLGSKSSALIAVTVDLHQWDDPFDITFSAECLARCGISANFFVTSEMFQQKRYAERLRCLMEYGHEVGSHSHFHDANEMRSLSRGSGTQLKFLGKSKQLFEDFYGLSPRVFRSPCWCKLSPRAIDELQLLGYKVDSSVTPQRLSFMGSYPYQGSWFFASRRLRYLRPGLLEVPSSAFLVPASSTAFRIMRSLSPIFVRLLIWEARNFRQRVVTLEFHPEDFNPDSRRPWIWSGLKPRDFLLRRVGGFGFRYYLQTSSYRQITNTSSSLLRLLKGHRIATLSEVERIVATGEEAIKSCKPTQAQVNEAVPGLDRISRGLID